jgi:hypothetical protein
MDGPRRVRSTIPFLLLTTDSSFPDAHTLKPLQRDGLVDVAVDPDDRRNRLITLTPWGHAKLAETDALWAKAQRGFEAAFGRVESESLREALRFLTSDGFATVFEGNLASPAR